MIKPGTIFNMQMHGYFPMCAIIPYTEQSYYILNLETGDIDFKGSLDEINTYWNNSNITDAQYIKLVKVCINGWCSVIKTTK
ncbi:hypothetical protein SY212_22050 [Ligilactobacillus agilis]|uniref:Uncharacterized protein n=1 Tax=Ligilactobacillus agilis TaxID=1601 RepID=A0A6F9XPR6_9LACO|nr:hypothetical protein [Ligilactobacillus agilis]GET07175.1 hypothetical protein SY212_22050 [Ligilactobacillus agilis]